MWSWAAQELFFVVCPSRVRLRECVLDDEELLRTLGTAYIPRNMQSGVGGDIWPRFIYFRDGFRRNSRKDPGIGDFC